MQMRRLILIGGGHSHVEVLRRFAAAPLPDVELILISPHPDTPYSGMLPGWIAGHYSRAQCHIDLARLCHIAKCRLMVTRCIGVNPEATLVFCEKGDSLNYDVVSVDTGGRSPAFDTPGALSCALAVRPVDNFIACWEAICKDAASGNMPQTVAMVGAGAAGVEVLLAMQFRLARVAPQNSVRFILVGDTAELLASHNASARRRFGNILRQRDVAVELGRKVERVDKGVLRCRDGSAIRADLIVWATGACAPLWPKAVGLETDDRGFILVNECLQSVSHPAVFAAGDIATVRNYPRPKSGVYAVRAGPPLAENLRCALLSKPMVRWAPQPQSLALISTGDRHAIASLGRIALQGDWVWRWKDWIDRRFMKRYEMRD
jgi:selenide, water dikinase